AIVPRTQLKKTLAQLIRLHQPQTTIPVAVSLPKAVGTSELGVGSRESGVGSRE
ncbi:MAG: hypothetical protein F6K26_13095, partial [Moorea sp. SIO2I5]|nr:hypothetical protein [Moorena sp. SIO2I5]